MKTARFNAITKILLLLGLTLSGGGAFSQMQIRSGLTLSGGESKYYDYMPLINSDYVLLPDGDERFDAAIGYKFRLLPAGKPFFVDLDLQAGYVRMKYVRHDSYLSSSVPDPRTGTAPAWGDVTENRFRMSFNPTFNGRIYDRWYAGIGVEPSYCIMFKPGEASERFSAFDMPLTARAGYDFKYMDLSFNYKYGFRDVMDAACFSG
ncbi:MAG: hypothetical protein LBJ23_07900, partial [Tannerella sp.]|nr:hypothetical protein [Tannerella sp.]